MPYLTDHKARPAQKGRAACAHSTLLGRGGECRPEGRRVSYAAESKTQHPVYRRTTAAVLSPRRPSGHKDIGKAGVSLELQRACFGRSPPRLVPPTACSPTPGSASGLGRSTSRAARPTAPAASVPLSAAAASASVARLAALFSESGMDSDTKTPHA